MSNGNPAPPPPPPPRNEGTPNFGEPSSLGRSLRDAVSLPLAGGTLSPAKVGKGYGVNWSKKFNKGGKVSASKRADGIAQRGKTRGKMV
jgi:hypothetical protein